MEEALSGVKRTLYCGELREEHIGQRVTIMGWVQKQRNRGSLIFLDIRDRKGVVQAVLSQDVYKRQGRDAVNILQTAGSSALLEERTHIDKSDVEWVLEFGQYVPREAGMPCKREPSIGCV